MLKLNLGSADRHFDGYVSVDRHWPACPEWPGCGMFYKQHVHSPLEFQVADLSSNYWPWNTSSVDAIIAYDIIEHLPNRINTMNEIWRTLVNGGIVDIEVPNASRGAGFYQDPTHVSAWCMNSFQYYQHGSFAVQRLADAYGILARFEIVSLSEMQCKDVVEDVWKIKAVLRAVK